MTQRIYYFIIENIFRLYTGISALKCAEKGTKTPNGLMINQNASMRGAQREREMGDKRKLQGSFGLIQWSLMLFLAEIDRCIKRIHEGISNFEGIVHKVTYSWWLS